MRKLATLLMLFAGWAMPQDAGTPRVPGQNANGMRVFLWTGLKTHNAGQHDYPQFFADWSKLLTERGAVVGGALRPPTREDLDKTDVVVIYKGDAGYLTAPDKAALEAFVQRGGGLVSLHDALCGPDPKFFSTLVGGGKKHGEVNYTLEAPVPYTVVDKAHPIMKDMSGMTLYDEAFFNMTWAPEPAMHVLATAEIAPTRSAGEHRGEKVPQIWTYEHSVAGGKSCASICLDARPHLRQLLELPNPTNSCCAASHGLRIDPPRN